MMRTQTVIVALALLVPSNGAAAADDPIAELSCQSEPSPGRVLCRLDLEARTGRLVWGDALVVRAPDFARPLRARIGAREGSARGERRLELPLAFVATKAGTGETEVLARAVVCSGQSELCVSVTRKVRAKIEVGVTEPAPR